MRRKGIILAGGSGTRLHPITKVVSKQLLPIYNKPMIFYPISTLMLAGIQDILIITTPEDNSLFKTLLGTGVQWGVNFNFAVQHSPDGLSQALIIAEEFLAGSPSALVLGDNIFFGDNLRSLLLKTDKIKTGASLFAYPVNDPERYGVAEIDSNNRILNIEEKPEAPKSNLAITGLYFYDNQASEMAKQIKPSARGELEITDLNKLYLEKDQLSCTKFGRGNAWFDTGTHESLLQASMFIQTIEHRQGLQVACLEEIAFHNKWIGRDSIIDAIKIYSKSSLGYYLTKLINENDGR
jgi:glucose-1-phosphate thymidylyltransferase